MLTVPMFARYMTEVTARPAAAGRAVGAAPRRQEGRHGRQAAHDDGGDRGRDRGAAEERRQASKPGAPKVAEAPPPRRRAPLARQRARRDLQQPHRLVRRRGEAQAHRAPLARRGQARDERREAAEHDVGVRAQLALQPGPARLPAPRLGLAGNVAVISMNGSGATPSTTASARGSSSSTPRTDHGAFDRRLKRSTADAIATAFSGRRPFSASMRRSSAAQLGLGAAPAPAVGLAARAAVGAVSAAALPRGREQQRAVGGRRHDDEPGRRQHDEARVARGGRRRVAAARARARPRGARPRCARRSTRPVARAPRSTAARMAPSLTWWRAARNVTRVVERVRRRDEQRLEVVVEREARPLEQIAAIGHVHEQRVDGRRVRRPLEAIDAQQHREARALGAELAEIRGAGTAASSPSSSPARGLRVVVARRERALFLGAVGRARVRAAGVARCARRGAPSGRSLSSSSRMPMMSTSMRLGAAPRSQLQPTRPPTTSTWTPTDSARPRLHRRRHPSSAYQQSRAILARARFVGPECGTLSAWLARARSRTSPRRWPPPAPRPP